MKYRKCRRCSKSKPVNEFHKCSKRKDGLQTWCKNCINEYKREWRDERRSPELQEIHKRIEINRKLISHGFKKCVICGEIKSLDEFWSGTEGIGNKRASCAACTQAKDNRHRHKEPGNPEDQARKRAWDAVNSGKIEVPKSCMACGRKPKTRQARRIHFHHTNGYDKEHWYTGIFLCTHCHSKVHLGKIEVAGTNWLPDD